jgi:HPt (histidine-containing phosphotransfer) domain-containing protein
MLQCLGMTSCPSAGSAAQLAPIDDRHLAELCAALGTEKLAKLLSLLAEELPKRISAIRCSHRADNSLRLRREVHNFRGMVSNFGLQRVANAAKEIELVPPGWQLENAIERLETEVQFALGCLSRPLPGLSNSFYPSGQV